MDKRELMRNRRTLRSDTVRYSAAVVTCVFLICTLISILYGDKKEAQRLTRKEKKIQKQQDENIRVLLKTNGFKEEVHPKVVLTSKGKMTVSYGEEQKVIEAGKEIAVNPDDSMFKSGAVHIEAEDGQKIIIKTLKRGYGIPSYRGSFDLYSTAEGIAIVNELSVESYLCAVVPSEMPASYEPEALKVQAVCARSYADCQTRDYSYPEYKAHVDDSTAFQVYGNSKEQEKSTLAVTETKGEKLLHQNEVVKTYYFSTSCGKTTDPKAWGNKTTGGNAYLKSVNVSDGTKDYEKKLPWYRWEAKIPIDRLSDLIELNTKTKIGTLKKLKITKTGQGGIALQLLAEGDKGKIVVDTENKIRAALGGSGYKIKRQDGKMLESTTLLPSAFIKIKKEKNTYIIKGGGYGHGIGMSQNGANEMAKAGKTYKEILQFFYHGVTVGSVKNT